MSNTPHINKWFEDFFKPAPEFNEANIKRWLSQKCIGYQVTDGKTLGVYHEQVEMRDGTIKDIWALVDWESPSPSQHMSQQPRIDRQLSEEDEAAIEVVHKETGCTLAELKARMGWE